MKHDRSSEIFQRARRLIPGGVNSPVRAFRAVGMEPIVIGRGAGAHVWDADGNQYLDFFGGIVTISVGHCNERVNRAVHEQVDRLEHVSPVLATEPQAALAQKIASLTPQRRLTKSFFTNSGTEANEVAILTARCATGSSEIVALRHSYHGRSSLGMALSGTSSWRLGGATQPGVVHAHNAYCYRCPFGAAYPACDLACARDVEDVIRTTTSGRIAGFIAEPIQGVGGFITPPEEYFRIVAEIVRRHGGLFVSDEVQTAWGRTGDKWFGIEHWNVEPDIMVSAKGMGNGAPVAVTIATPEVADKYPGITFATFGGNPVSMAAALSTLQVIEEDDLRTNARVVGAYLRERLEELKERHPLVGDVRGMGLMQGLELVKDRKTKEPAPQAVLDVFEECKRLGVLIGKGGLDANVIRLGPPLNATTAHMDQLVAALDQGLTFAAKR